MFQVPKAARSYVQTNFGDRKPVTITLREAEHYTFRNSNIKAWLKFAGDLKDKGEDVIFIRDTAKGNETITGFETHPPASFNISARAAIYERAKCNLFVSNGPCSLAWFLPSPYLTFIRFHDPNYEVHSTDFWREQCGLEPGAQWPWAKPGQRLVYEADDYENLCAAWEEHDGSTKAG